MDSKPKRAKTEVIAKQVADDDVEDELDDVEESDDVEDDLDDVEKEFITTKFSLQVATHVIQQHLSKSKSVVCSPVSIDALLSILALAVENSTLEQLLTLLGHRDVKELNKVARKLRAVLKSSRDIDKDGPKISFVNGLWLDQRFSLKAGFQKELKDVHKVEARVVDFANE
ncbi:serpin-ZX-like, partial [Silene latifolia]|uniref:serpin-ZX-like n=1 Tax=Silene latifolia TaxID=37657 RepID=UPI003D77AC6B